MVVRGGGQVPEILSGPGVQLGAARVFTQLQEGSCKSNLLSVTSEACCKGLILDIPAIKENLLKGSLQSVIEQ